MGSCRGPPVPRVREFRGSGHLSRRRGLEQERRLAAGVDVEQDTCGICVAGVAGVCATYVLHALSHVCMRCMCEVRAEEGSRCGTEGR